MSSRTVRTNWHPLKIRKPRLHAAIDKRPSGEERRRSQCDCSGRYLHWSDATTTAPASRRRSVSRHCKHIFRQFPPFNKEWQKDNVLSLVLLMDRVQSKCVQLVYVKEILMNTSHRKLLYAYGFTVTYVRHVLVIGLQFSASLENI
jgi:hypothetical protein